MPAKYPLKEITLTAWRMLLAEKIDSLPVDPFAVAAGRGIKVLTYGEYCGVMGLTRAELADRHGRDGFTLVIDGRYLIFYNEDNNGPRIRWTVTHELCHIFLGHFEAGAQPQPGHADQAAGGKSRPESDADELTARVLSPMIVLHLSCVSSLDELQKMTGLSREASLYRWKRLCHVRRVKKVLTHKLEMEVVLQFQHFITTRICEKVRLLKQLENPASNEGEA